MLLDGNSLAYRAFYALPAENFKTQGGLTTNAVYGFTAMLINLLRDEQPTHIAAAFDVFDVGVTAGDPRELVPGSVAVHVIERLETVEIKEQERAALLIPPCPLQGLVQPVTAVFQADISAIYREVGKLGRLTCSGCR